MPPSRLPAAIACFVAGFALAQWWGWFRARWLMTGDASALFGSAPSAWFVSRTSVELALAALVFGAVLAWQRPREGARLHAGAMPAAALLGAVAATFTVGTYALMPVVSGGTTQRLLDLACVAVACAALGMLVARFRRSRSPG